ncbi:hypothetical protein VW35_17020 [Devosia soli]|uniref:Uncharacterized protein n=1 Tax=Devosia soli TaxID=361041 RepID=A0A0F5L297_9HYPH|nr:hypothetical protein VW35_17020 [Devosia soli]
MTITRVDHYGLPGKHTAMCLVVRAAYDARVFHPTTKVIAMNKDLTSRCSALRNNAGQKSHLGMLVKTKMPVTRTGMHWRKIMVNLFSS